MSNNQVHLPDVSEHFPNRLVNAGAPSEHLNAAAPQDCLLLWQFSQLDYVCGNVHIDLPELVDTVNCMYGFICDGGQTAIKDVLVDEAGELTPCHLVNTLPFCSMKDLQALFVPLMFALCC